MAEQECLPMQHAGHATDIRISTEKACDPVCGMMVERASDDW
jgi:hypothetical protein